MFFRAARKLTLTPEQLTKLDALESSLDEDGAAAQEEVKAARADLATGIKAGKVDAGKLEPRLQTLDKLASARAERAATALGGLHALLEPAQRQKLVTDFKAAKFPADGASEGDGGAAIASKRRLGWMTRDLDLDADQKKKVDAIKLDHKSGEALREGPRQVEAMLPEFEKDGFDAKKQTLTGVYGLRALVENEAYLATQLLPILKPEQREKLAAQLDKDKGHGGIAGGAAGGRRGPDRHVPEGKPSEGR
jgi:Spy/CpxP family protein refolding chaperone